ncbi:MAG: glycosyltransferase [Rhizobiaceae bacterium]|nr:glycosyltransferase [Rhizobiaceae bacterium]
MDFGLKEGRQFPGLQTKRGSEAEETIAADWNVFHLKDEIVAVRVEKVAAKLPPLILDQIRHQARHDGAIFACGRNAFAKLRQVDADDLIDRCGLDVDKLLASIETPPHSIIIISRLIAGDAKKYAADLADALQFLLRNPGFGYSNRAKLDRGNGLARADHPETLPQHPDHLLERHVQRLERSDTRRSGSFPQFDASKGYSGCKQHDRSGCGRSIRARPLAIRQDFLRLLQPGITWPVPNVWGDICTTRLAICNFTDRQQTTCALATSNNFPAEFWPADDASASRHLRRTGRGIWISRVEPLKGTGLLAALASARQADRFHIFGPLQDDPERMGLNAPNIQIHDLVSDVSATDFTSYVAFIFTSLFEGMPNIVLEMSQHAIPMVLADIGGLRDTFDEDAVVFVKHLDLENDTARAFSRALDQHRQSVAAAFLPGDP